jgi:hypothetical protein
MIISEHDIKLVGYVCAEARASEAYPWTYQPIGTAFFVKVPIEIPNRELEMRFFYYLVTCAHVINAPVDTPRLYHGPLSLTLPHRDGVGTCERALTERFEIFSDWDLAIAPIGLPDDAGIVPLHFGRIKPPLVGMEIGLNTCSIGLFSHHPGKSRPRPFVRFGHLSIPDTRIEALPKPNVHLIESRSWGGESGSPVFFYYDQYTEPRWAPQP